MKIQTIEKNGDNGLTIKTEETIEFTDSQLHTLKTICEQVQPSMSKIGCWEFRDPEDDDNFDRQGILKLKNCLALEEYGLLDRDVNSWHTTFVLTNKGNKIYEILDLKNKTLKNKI